MSDTVTLVFSVEVLQASSATRCCFFWGGGGAVGEQTLRYLACRTAMF